MVVAAADAHLVAAAVVVAVNNQPYGSRKMLQEICHSDAAQSEITARISACRNSCHDTDVEGCLYIMRHGRTDWNVLKKLQGRTDIPLNEEGRAMAENAREEYKNVHFDICYCSPLVRARETAQIVLRGRNIPIIFDDRLIEMSFGIYEGVENAYKNPDCPMINFFSAPENYVPGKGGESFAELFARTGNFLHEVVEPKLAEGKDVLIVGHGAMNSSIICQVKKIPLANFWDAGIENCKLKKLL